MLCINKYNSFLPVIENIPYLKNGVFWDVTPCDSVMLMMEALSSSETSVLTRATLRNIPEEATLHSHCSVNLKSYIFHTCLRLASEWNACRGQDVDLLIFLIFYLPANIYPDLLFGIVQPYLISSDTALRVSHVKEREVFYAQSLSLTPTSLPLIIMGPHCLCRYKTKEFNMELMSNSVGLPSGL
jgi:hypothetical protein